MEAAKIYILIISVWEQAVGQICNSTGSSDHVCHERDHAPYLHEQSKRWDASE